MLLQMVTSESPFFFNSMGHSVKLIVTGNIMIKEGKAIIILCISGKRLADMWFKLLVDTIGYNTLSSIAVCSNKMLSV